MDTVAGRPRSTRDQRAIHRNPAPWTGTLQFQAGIPEKYQKCKGNAALPRVISAMITAAA